jgi:hypothetical protein
MAGDCSVATCKGRPLFGEKEGRVRIESQIPLIVSTSHLHPLPLSQERGEKERAKCLHGFDFNRRAETGATCGATSISCG